MPQTGRRQTNRPSNHPFLARMFGKKLDAPETIEGERTVVNAAGLLVELDIAEVLGACADATTGVLVDLAGGEITAEFSSGAFEDLDESSSCIHSKLKITITFVNSIANTIQQY